MGIFSSTKTKKIKAAKTDKTSGGIIQDTK